MTLHSFSKKDKFSSRTFNENVVESLRLRYLNHIRQLIDRNIPIAKDQTDLFSEAYTSAGGRKGTVNTGDTTATFSTNKYTGTNHIIVHNITSGLLSEEVEKAFGICFLEDIDDDVSVDFKLSLTNPPLPHIFIEAVSLDPDNLTINGCRVYQMSAGKWLLYNVDPSEEVRRAKMIQTLFYGTTGLNPRVVNIVGLTALKTTVTRDIGKRGIYVSSTNDQAMVQNPITKTYTGTFSNTTTNVDISTWSRIQNVDTFMGNGIMAWELPSGTVLNSRTGVNSGVTDEIGTDTEADEKDNQTNVRVRFQTTSATNSTVGLGSNIKAIILSNGTISWSTSGSNMTNLNVDFTVTHSVPVFTDGTSETIIPQETDWFPLDANGSVSEFTPFLPNEMTIRLTGGGTAAGIRGFALRLTK